MLNSSAKASLNASWIFVVAPFKIWTGVIISFKFPDIALILSNVITPVADFVIVKLSALILATSTSITYFAFAFEFKV